MDDEQHRLVERAQRRIRQKKQLYSHLVFFLVGGVFLIALNKVLKYGEEYDWSYWIMGGWAFLLILHAIDVFVTKRLLGPEWEREERERLVRKQQKRIARLEKQVGEAASAQMPTDTSAPMPTDTPAPMPTDTPFPSPASTATSAQQLLLIAAAGEKNELGLKGDLPWHLPDDFKRFKSLTMGHPMIMGRKTFDTFPSPLPKRDHIIITRDRKYKVDHPLCTVVHSLEEALKATSGSPRVYVIGGGEIYNQALPYATGVELTRVHGSYPADTFFPKLDPDTWLLTASEHHPADERHDTPFTYETYVRK